MNEITSAVLLNSLGFALRLTAELIPLFLVVSTLVYLLTDRLTPERLRRWLGSRSGWLGVPLATILGAVTPFCSCSTVPLANGLLRSGVPTSTLVAFLVASPLVSPVAIALLGRYFGWGYSLLYSAAGMTLAAAGGWFIGRNRTASDELAQTTETDCDVACDAVCDTAPIAEVNRDGRAPLVARLSIQARARRLATEFRNAFQRSFVDLRKLAWPLLVAVGIGALIHDYLPAQALSRVIGPDSLFAIPAAAAFGVPVYASIVVLMPLSTGLLAKGASVGAVTAFLMASSGFSLPEGIMLSRILPRRLLLEIVLVFTAGVIGIGYGFQYLIPS